MEASRGESMLSGRYSLERELARGGMGSLWIATDVRLKRSVAVKLIGAAAISTDELRIRFEREALAVAKLKSPHVVQIHDYGFDQGIAYIVMELLEGEDLRARLDRVPWLPVPEVRTIVEQIGKALEHIHAAGIVHRDLKPANVFLAKMNGDELVKVIDFGIVRTGDDGKRLTHAAHLLGTPRYMSPEQIRHFDQVDSRSDLWSLAVIAYRALTGRFPYPGESPAELAESYYEKQLVPATRVAPELPPWVDMFFARALAIKPQERYATVTELTTAFGELLRVVRRGTLQFGTDRRMLVSLPDESTAPPTVPLSAALEPVAPTTARDPASEVTVRRERPERPKAEPLPPAAHAAPETSDEPAPPTMPASIAADEPAPPTMPASIAADEPAPPTMPTPIAVAEPAPPTMPTPIAVAEPAPSAAPEDPGPPVKPALIAAAEPAPSAAPEEPAPVGTATAARPPEPEPVPKKAPARPEHAGVPSRTPRIVAGVLVLAAIAGSVAVLQTRWRQGRVAPITVLDAGTTPSAAAAATATEPTVVASAVPSASAAITATVVAPDVAAPNPTVAPVSKPLPTLRPRNQGGGDDPYSDVPTWGRRRNVYP